MRWLRRLTSRKVLEHDLDKELKFHVDTRVDELVARGVPAAEARRRAMAEFGGLESAKEGARDARGTRWVEDLGMDVRYALRMFRSNKAFAIAAVFSLAIGIGANASVYRVIDGLVLRRLDVPAARDLFLIQSSESQISQLSYPIYQKLAAVAPAANLAAFTSPVQAQVAISAGPELQNLELVSGNWFSLLGVTPQTGRLFGNGDDDLSSVRPVVVISSRFWSLMYGREESAVGSTLRLNGMPCTIIGVARDGFDGMHVGTTVEIWAPLAMQHTLAYHRNSSSEDSDDSKPWGPQEGISWLAVAGRASVANQAAMLSAIDGRYRQIISGHAKTQTDDGRRAQMLRDHIQMSDASRGLSSYRRTLTPALNLLMGMVALVLLVTCANLANLLLSRGAARGREFALRLSIGARRGRLVRQLLTEAVTLALIGGGAGLILSLWAAPALLQLTSADSALSVPLSFDWTILAGGFLASIATGVIFGVIPAVRLSSPAMQEALKSGGRVVNATSRRGRPQIAKVLVAVQVAIAVLLVTGAAFFMQTFTNYLRVDIGLDRHAVISARFDARLAGFVPAQLPGVYARLLEEARRVPGVTSASLDLIGPVTGGLRQSSIEVQGYQRARGEEIILTEELVGPDYFATVGQRLLAGRDFDSRDTATSSRVAVINETMAKTYFKGADPVGRTFTGDETTPNRVIGVVSDVRSTGLKGKVPALAYYPLAQYPNEYARNLYVRGRGNTGTIVEELKRAINRAEPRLAVREIVTLEQLAERTVSAERLVSRLAMAFSLLGVLVACFGLYGTISYAVARRTNEIGVRLALGASPLGVRWMVVRETLWLIGFGIAGGLALVLVSGQLLAAQIFGLSPRDPATLAGAAIVVMGVATLAGALPAWRASRVNPLSALRAE